MAEGTHFQKFAGRIRTEKPTTPKSGEVQFDTDGNAFMVYDGTNWRGIALSTTTSTTTSTSTSTSTSTTTTTS